MKYEDFQSHSIGKKLKVDKPLSLRKDNDVKNIHENVKKYECDSYNKIFDIKGNFKKHVCEDSSRKNQSLQM